MTNKCDQFWLGMFTDWTIAKNLVVKPVVGFDVWEGERLLQHDKIALYVLTLSKPFLIVMHLKCSLSFNQTAVCIKRSCVHQVSQKLLRMQNKSQPSYLSECKCTMKTRGDNNNNNNNKNTSHVWSQEKTPPLFDEGFMHKTSVTHTWWWTHNV